MTEKDILFKLSVERTIEARKRTNLAFMRTGIMLSTVPLSVFTVLISASNFYDVWEMFYPLIVLVLLCLSLLVLGIYMIVNALHQIDLCERELEKIGKLY